ncbi:hypothetical protein Bbelb_280360 [Branchiostoma belcheri]|nr:hypothetical protein Bbelb_280360 [Branchiostoma belcheri]
MARDLEGITPMFGHREQSLLSRLHQMRNDGELCDVTIIVQSQEFRCHNFSVRPPPGLPVHTCRIRLTKENATEVQHAAKFLNIEGVAEACAELLQNSGTIAGHHDHTTEASEKSDALASGSENSTKTPVTCGTNSNSADKFLNIKGVAETCTKLLQNSETMAGCHTTESEETGALGSGSGNSSKTPVTSVSTSSDDMVHKKETLQGSTTCEVTHEEDDMIKAVDRSQHASQHVANIDTESEKNSTHEKASCTPLSKTFVSKNTMQGSPLDDSNASDCGNVETKDEAELPILSQWLQTSDVDEKTAINKELYPSEDSPKELNVSEEDLNQLLLEKLETELGGIPTIEDLDEDPIVWDPMGWIQDDPDCLEGERSEVRSKASSGAHCDDDEGFRRKRKLSGEMFPGTKRSKMDVQTASAHMLSDDSSEGCAKKKDPVLYSMLKDTFDVTELQTPKMKMPASECSTLPGRDQSRNGDYDNVVQTNHQLESKTSTNKALETKIDSSPANLHPFSMSENSLAESRKPCYPLARKDPERYKIPSNPNSTDQQKTFFGDFTAIRDTSQHGDVPLNIPTNMKLRGVCDEENGTGAVPYSQNAQLRTVHNPEIVDKPRSVFLPFGERVVARDLFSTEPSVPQLQNLQFKTVHHPSIFTGSGERVVSQDLHNPTMPYSQNLQYKTVHNPGIVDKPRSVSPSFGDNVVAQDLCVSKPTVSHSQNMQFKTVHNPGNMDKQRSVLLSFGERVVARDLFSNKPTVPQSQNLQFKTACTMLHM